MDEIRATALIRPAMRARCASDYFVSRAGLTLCDSLSDEFVFGFGCSYDPDIAEDLALYELGERVLSLPSFYGCGSGSISIPLLTDCGEHFRDDVLANHLIGSRFDSHILGGNGTAIHETVENAISHARCESFERHFVSQLWFSGCVLDVDYSCHPFLYGDHHIFSAPVYIDKEAYWLSFSVMEGSSPLMFSCGSALCFDRGESISHSCAESVMIFEDAIDGNIGPHQAGHDRILRLRDVGFVKILRDRLFYLADLCVSNRCNKCLYAPPREDGFCAILYESRDISVVRYHHLGLDAPHYYTASSLVPNPFL